MELTKTFIILGFSNGALRLLFRENGILYCQANAHASAVTAMAYCPASMSLLTVGEDSFIRVWQIGEENQESKIEHIQNELVEDMMLCGVQFLNNNGSRFGVVGYDRNEIVVYNRT